jgi:CheY-like chemotaxis protein
LRRANITNKIIILNDGRQATDYLFGEGDYSGIGRATPLLVVLDLNLPVLDGFQVLRRMKEDMRTKRIPVIILTTTDDAREVANCYQLGCNMYIIKPVEYEQFSEAIRKIGLFLSVVKIPNGE